ncbi:MAG: hypothetical protein WCD86_06225 [Ktedonobacteraceae bacterium]
MKSLMSLQHSSNGDDDQQGFARPTPAIHQDSSKQRGRPRRSDIFLHVFKTLKLIGALVTDRRVPLWSKLLFVSAIAGLLALLLFPDVLDEVVLSAILPLVGTLLGLPLDAGFDWLAFALALVSLLHVFPAPLVAEHYGRIFHR